MRSIAYAVVPFRFDGKARLAPAMSRGERRELSVSMLCHVVNTLRDLSLRVLVVSPARVDDVDAEWVRDPGRGLNWAVRSALEGHDALVMVADLPDVTTHDIQTLEQAPCEVAVARTRDGGTSALLMRTLIEPRFGKASALVHALAARKRGLTTQVLDLKSLTRDVDVARDLIRPSASWPLPSASRP